MRNALLLIAAALLPVAAPFTALPETGQVRPADAGHIYGKRWKGYVVERHRVAMRDGVKLNTYILYPRDIGEALPLLLIRNPYGWDIRDIDGRIAGDLRRDGAGVHDSLIREGFIFILQDERGAHGSEGTFDLMRFFASLDDPNGADDITDVQDTIEWALKATRNNNGRVGMIGTSYRGWHTAVGLIRPHPALKAAMPSAAMVEPFRGDDFYHNGAFQMGYALPFLTSKMDKYASRPTLEERIATEGEYAFFLRHDTLKALQSYFPSPSPITRAVISNDRENDYWQARRLTRFVPPVATVPTLHVISSFDAEDLAGPLALYRHMESNDRSGLNRIVMGPWYHGGWRYEDSRTFGPLDFGSDTGRYFREQVERPFLRHHLKGAPAPDLPEALIYDTGRNAWQSFGSWPPQNTRKLELYPHADGRLMIGAPPRGKSGSRSYIADPANPVPYRADATKGGFAKDYKVADQRFLEGRPDVLSFTSAPLDRSITVAGPVHVDLHAATTGTDTDWVVKLIDVYPDNHPELPGYQRMIASEILRAKFRNSLSKPKPVVPGEPTHYRITLPDLLHSLPLGHRLMVQIQSSWFPLFDRNPNSFMTIAEAESADFRKVRNTIFLSRSMPTRVTISILR